jgi:hypothetical protein
VQRAEQCVSANNRISWQGIISASCTAAAGRLKWSYRWRYCSCCAAGAFPGEDAEVGVEPLLQRASGIMMRGCGFHQAHLAFLSARVKGAFPLPAGDPWHGLTGQASPHVDATSIQWTVPRFAQAPTTFDLESRMHLKHVIPSWTLALFFHSVSPHHCFQLPNPCSGASYLRTEPP